MNSEEQLPADGDAKLLSLLNSHHLNVCWYKIQQLSRHVSLADLLERLYSRDKVMRRNSAKPTMQKLRLIRLNRKL